MLIVIVLAIVRATVSWRAKLIGARVGLLFCGAEVVVIGDTWSVHAGCRLLATFHNQLEQLLVSFESDPQLQVRIVLHLLTAQQ